MILTVFMALGAWRISRSRVLTRRLPAIEALGAATVLCTDKTGTLTENRMRVAQLWAPGALHDVGDGPLPEAVHEVVEFGILASQRDPFDPMEQAFHRLGASALAGTEHLHERWTLVREYPLSPHLLACPTSGGRRTAGGSWSRRRAPRRRSPTSATWRRPRPRKWPRAPRRWPRTDCASSRSRASDFAAARAAGGPARLRLSSSSGSSASRIRCGRACRRRWPSAPARECASS